MSHEPRGLRNCNPFNVRISNQKWKGKLSDNTDGVFEQFDTIENGIRCGLIILRTYIEKYHLVAIDTIIRRFAPSNENDTEAYIKTVCHETGFERFQTLEFTLDDMLPLVKSICFVENGGHLITNDQIMKAWSLI
jgi:hypothetical protein